MSFDPCKPSHFDGKGGRFLFVAGWWRLLIFVMQLQIYLVVDNRILVISYGNIGTSEPEAEVFFGPGPGHVAEAEIIGLSVSTLGSTIYINVKNRGLFAYHSHGRLIWSVGPVLYQFGYRQGCRKNLTDCYFASVPVLDQCEGSIYVRFTHPWFIVI